MYHAMVKRIARKNLLRVNNKEFGALLGDCAPNIHHRFVGRHALGSERHDRAALARCWFDRLGRLGVIPLAAVTGLWLWKQRRIAKLLRRRSPAERA
ncbi:hypothetical protein [Aureimonas psammosilenae]|uniref:hypothetical protein n=1 Tax=Aureimonas psammosilenae TaxID=2495496 RepID=UPI001AEEC82E|nr:hypothetical protein [Aureimonas psammosilenae]